MSYIELITAFVAPWVVLELLLLFKRNDPIKTVLSGVLAVGAITIIISAPLNQILASQGILEFNSSESLFMIGLVPFEIYGLIAGMCLFSGLILYFLRPRIHPVRIPSRWIKLGGVALLVPLAITCLIMLREPSLNHMGVILLWFSIVMGSQWFFGGSLVWRTKSMFISACLFSTGYFCLIDAFAIHKAYWGVNPFLSSGISLFGLPIERVLYYLSINLCYCQGLELFWYLNRRKGLFTPREQARTR